VTLRQGRCVIDACKKGPEEGHDREWPDELSFDETIQGPERRPCSVVEEVFQGRDTDKQE
jgi:3-polyprenyl-4-hydroxybenzoate decarboxylase